MLSVQHLRGQQISLKIAHHFNDRTVQFDFKKMF